MRIFVASTYEDLLGYRSAVTRSILASGDVSEDMLYWPAEECPPLDASREILRSADLLILLIAHRYGTLPTGHDRSITELEFDAAMELGVPVLAFIVDPDYPWPPRYVEREREASTRLEEFIWKINAAASRTGFTSPESLEIAIAHSLAQFTGREKAARPSRYPRRLMGVSRPESLHHLADTVIELGYAPDGIPLLLCVTRSIHVRDDLGAIAGRLGKSLDDPVFREVFDLLNQEARRFAAARGVHAARVAGRQVDFYVSGEPLSALVAPTLVQSMLEGIPGTANTVGRQPSPPTPTVASGHGPSHPGDSGISSLGGRNRYLCVALDCDQVPWSGGWASGLPGVGGIAVWRPFIEEGLERLPGVQYIIERDELEDVLILVKTNHAAQFSDNWLELLTSAGEEELTRTWHRIQVPRSSLMRFMLEVVDEVAALHDNGILHGDIKPGNVLVSRGGGTLIDEADLRVGDISPTATPGWSASEQLLRRPLSCAADVFSLGQLLLRLLGGELLGREVRYHMPGGETATVVEDPSVYLRSGASAVAGQTRGRWRDLIERSLRTDPAGRWPTARAMGDAMREILAAEEPKGNVSIALPWGQRPALYSNRKGEPAVGWVIHAGHAAGSPR